MTTEKKCCGTCGFWKQGAIEIIGECGPEGEGTTYDHLCDINLWRPKEVLEKPSLKDK